MDEKATMGQSLRNMEDEETIDLMELARLLWAHAVQILSLIHIFASGELVVDNSSDDATKPTVSEFTKVNYIQ